MNRQLGLLSGFNRNDITIITRDDVVSSLWIAERGVSGAERRGVIPQTSAEHLSTWRQILIGPYAKLDPSVPSGFVLRLLS